MNDKGQPAAANNWIQNKYMYLFVAKDTIDPVTKKQSLEVVIFR